MNIELMPLSPFEYSPSRTLPAKIKRRATGWSICKPLGPLPGSMITFSFDDFPISAADTGADIMASINAPAIYYACSGLAGKTNQTGEQYSPDHLLALAKAGHEIGAHTHTHLDCAQAAIDRVLDDIDHNLHALEEMGLTQPVKHFAYPYGETTRALKRALDGKFQTCRGILPGQNKARADRMQLRAMELSPDNMTTERALQAIETALKEPTWLHIFTHDVRKTPSDFGTTPASLKQIAKTARDSQLPIVTPSQAMAQLSGALDV